MKKELMQLGLTENEASIYLVLLEEDNLKPQQIAKKTNLSRPYVYDTLENLMKKGMVTSVEKDGKKHFQPANPKNLLLGIQEKEAVAKELVSSLLSLAHKGSEEVKVELYEGRRIVRIFLSELKDSVVIGKKPPLIIGVDERIYEKEDRVALAQYFEFLKENKIKERVIAEKGAEYLPGGKATQYKFLPKEYFSPNTIAVYNDKVALVIFGNPNYMVVIKSKLFADSYKKHFNILWGVAEKR